MREQKEIDSSLGFVATNLDYIWSNYKTGQWMLLEEKRYNRTMTYSQEQQFKVLHKTALNNIWYKGFHLIVFENTNPADGFIKLNNAIIKPEDFIQFLMF